MADLACPDCGCGMVMVEYAYGCPQRYDGWSETICVNEDCHLRIGRWSNKRLAEGEEELRFGGEA